MRYPHFRDCKLLAVEDEPLIVMDIAMAFERTGAKLTTTNSVKEALVLVEQDDFRAAILDNALQDDDGARLTERLTELGIPFLIYSGHAKAIDRPDIPHLIKPASHEEILDAMNLLISGTERSKRR